MRYPAPAAAIVLALLTGAAPAARQAQPPSTPPRQQPAPPPAQTEAERAQQPPIRSGINFVRVDVIISDKQGNPVLDLKPEEFTVTEDGKPQKVESFSIVKIDPLTQMDAQTPREIRSMEDEREEASRPDARLFVMLLDDYHVRRGNDMSVRKPLMDFVLNQLAPADMVAIMYPLTSVTELHFTRDRNALARAIERFEGRKFEYTPRNQFEEQYAYYPAATVEKVRNDVTMGALKGAAIRLGGLREGRKSIIFVSEGFTGTLPPQLNDPVAAMKGLGNPARGNPSVQGPGDSVEFFRETEMLSELQEVFNTANRQNTSIYAVDPRGLTSFEYDINEAVGLQTDSKKLNATMDTLRILADNTDGRAIVNRNDIGTGMKQIIRDASGYYLLGYNSSQAPTDGRFHEIKVRVTRKGMDVRARKGYWAYTADDVARASAAPAPDAPTAVTAALNAIAEPARGRPARFWIGTSQGPGGSPRVTFSWEPVAAPADTRTADNVPARVMLTATTPDGRPIYRGRIPEEGAAAPAPAASATPGSAPTGGSGATAVAPSAATAFEAPPGQLQLRMVVENGRGQVMDSVTQELTVPDFSRVQVSMSTPRVYRARTMREVQILKGNVMAPPTADRAFSRSERLLVRVDAYGAGGEQPAVTARLLNRTGAQMADLPAGQGTPGQAEFELGLSALAAGDYLIELNAKSASGTAQELVAFKVGR